LKFYQQFNERTLIGWQGRIQEFVQGGLNYIIFPGGGGDQHPLGPENPLKSINFTGPGGA